MKEFNVPVFIKLNYNIKNSGIFDFLETHLTKEKEFSGIDRKLFVFIYTKVD
jgi:hypothetical protein